MPVQGKTRERPKVDGRSPLRKRPSLLTCARHVQYGPHPWIVVVVGVASVRTDGVGIGQSWLAALLL